MLIVGLISFIVYWVFVVHIFRKWGFDSTLTISDHIAIGDQRKHYNPRAIFLISIFMLYVLIYLLPKYNTGFISYALAFTVWIGELAAIRFPRHGKHFTVHDKLTLLVGSSVLILILVIGFSAGTNQMVHYLTGVSVTLLVIASLPIIRQQRRKNFLFFQSAFYWRTVGSDHFWTY